MITVDGDAHQQVIVTDHFLGGEQALAFIQPSSGYSITPAQIDELVAAPVDTNTDTTTNTDTQTGGASGTATTAGSATSGNAGTSDNTVGSTPAIPQTGGDDVLTGTSNNDWLVGGAGNDSLSGGKGNDQLIGGQGDDTYLFAAGDGQDVIQDQAGTNTLRFTGGVTFSQVGSGLTKSGNDLILKVNGGPDQVTIDDFFSQKNTLQSIEFETGGAISAEQIFGVFGLSAPSASGSVYDAKQVGDNQANTLTSTTGNDLLIGGRGDDTYLFTKGDGQDVIDNRGGGHETLRFTGAIGFNDVAAGLTKMGDDLILKISGTTDQVTIQNFFKGGDYVMDSIEFESGGALSADQIFGAYGLSNPNPTSSPDYANLPNEQSFGTVTLADSADQAVFGSSDADMIDAGAGNDVLQGNGGNDYLMGGQGNDQYVFGRGDGQDIINNFSNLANETDQLTLGGGMTKDDLWFTQQGQDLVIDLSGADDQIKVAQWFDGEAYQLDEIHAGDDLLLKNKVDALVSAMAAFDHPAAGDLAISQTVRDDTATALAVAWS